jgi:cytochrome c2
MIIAYLRDMNAATATEKLTGNVDNGDKLFAARCSSCHRVGDSGGWLGPDLSRVGAARSREGAGPRNPDAVGMDAGGLRERHARHE